MISIDRTLKLSVLVLLLIGLTSCAVPAPTPTYPEITFSHLPTIRLNVAEVDIIENYVPPHRAPNVDHLFPITPMAALRQWVVDRIEAAGQTRRGRVIIEDARVVAVALPVRKGLQGLFYKEQEVRYDAAMEARVEVRSDRGYRDSFATARVVRSKTVPEEMTLAEKDELFFKLTEDLIKELNSVLEANIREHMGKDLI
ncbi:MAG: hypothetical protein CL569_09035 [Alphaproteobacteria bacterium]|nr:hypothetical protein [Alphaproteobacteria bacterium]|tara:strand:- start:615 stop:1211 length:597 start_codon:yes stop_codon:yes gene_type:complete